MSVPRLGLIQDLIHKRNYSKYLEIGVSIGTVFFRVNCAQKIAVDPHFRFNKLKIFTRSVRLKNLTNFKAKYFEETSDDFFQKDAKKVMNKDLDICLVDGMHEYSYALKDILNTVKYLKDDGVIIVHDCNPEKQENACSYKEWELRGQTGIWNGDVWKAIVYLRTFHPELNVFVADTDYGLGIITKKPHQTQPLRFSSYEQIDQIPFKEFDANRKEWLDLKPASYLNEFFNL